MLPGTFGTVYTITAARGGGIFQLASVPADPEAEAAAKRQRDSEDNTRQVARRLESPESPPKPGAAAAAPPPPADDAPLSPSGHWAMGDSGDSTAPDTDAVETPMYRSLAAVDEDSQSDSDSHGPREKPVYRGLSAQPR